MLQGTDRISRDTPARSLRGGTSTHGTHRAPPDRRAHRRSSGPSHHRRLCCPAAQPVLRPPPTPTRPAIHFPGSPVIGRHAPMTRFRRSPGRGGPPQFPPPPSTRSAPHTPGSPSRLRFQALRRFHGLRPDFVRLGTPCSRPRAGPLTTPQASRHATDRIVAPPYRAFDAGLRPGPFPDQTASLLPGLLAATRTGLPPAGDDELTNSKIHHGATSQCHLRFCWAHERPRLDNAPRMSMPAPLIADQQL